MKALARHARTDVETLARVLGPDLVAFARHSAHTPAPERRKTRAWTDAQLRQALRKAALVLDGDVREARYRDLATRPGASAPSSQTIIRRFGSWNAALESAGVGAVQPLRSYDKWTLELCADVVAEFIAETGSTSGSQYREWAVGREDCPSAATIEKVGLWHEVVNRALPLLVVPDLHAQYVARLRAEHASRRRAISSPSWRTARRKA